MRKNPYTTRSIEMTTFQDYHQPTHKILRIKQVIECTGVSRSTLYDIQDPKSPRHDPSFPKKVQITLGSVGWIANEINLWIESRMNKSRY